MMTPKHTHTPSWPMLGWTICCIAALYYCYAFVLRVFPSIMADGLRHTYHLNATDFGIMATFYYVAYTPMQLLVGIIIDRYGARIVLSIACLIATLGVFMFIMATDIQALKIARFTMGFGAAFGYVTVLKLASLWLPPNRFAMMAGLTTAIGMTAAISSDFILTNTVQTLGINHSLKLLLIVGLALFVIILFTVKSRPNHIKGQNTTPNITLKMVFAQFWRMLLKPQMWLIGIIGMVLYMPSSIFLDIWGIPYLRVTHHLTAKQANISIMLIFVGWLIASPIIGAISDHIEKRKPPLLLCSLGATIIISIVFYAPELPLYATNVLLLLFGLLCGVHPLCFAISKENNNKYYAGSAVALTNAFIMVGGFFQPIVGKFLDLNWHGAYTASHIRLYESHNYTIALSILPIALAISTLLTLFVKETHCQEYPDNDTQAQSKTKQTIAAQQA